MWDQSEFLKFFFFKDCFSGKESIWNISERVGWTDDLWTAVEKLCNLLMLLNLYFYITSTTLFIWTIIILKYRLLILSLSAMLS